ncbi:UNVERIFIED_CONTAM: hypothetical protein FKN15_001675 [Acipenser sinensis]
MTLPSKQPHRSILANLSDVTARTINELKKYRKTMAADDKINSSTDPLCKNYCKEKKINPRLAVAGQTEPRRFSEVWSPSTSYSSVNRTSNSSKVLQRETRRLGTIYHDIR